MNYKRYILMLLVVLAVIPATYAQQDNRHLVRKGNSLYLDSLFTDAETTYRKAINKKKADPVAHFNLGNTLLRERNPKDAAAQYVEVLKHTKNPLYLAKTYHNLGVIFQSQKQYSEAINNYENALRNNSKDNETRYNLALCRHLLKNQKNNKQQNKNNKNDKNNKQNNKKNQPQKQKNQQNQDKQQQQQQNQMSKDNAERLLNLAKQNEQRTQDKLHRNMRYSQPRQVEKNW